LQERSQFLGFFEWAETFVESCPSAGLLVDIAAVRPPSVELAVNQVIRMLMRYPARRDNEIIELRDKGELIVLVK
jgi:hypothetical protein